MKSGLSGFAREILFKSAWFRRHFLPGYAYNFNPPQLFFLCQCIEDTKQVAGDIAEIGCAHGLTTVFLNKYMDARHIQRRYYAIDTFSGFVTEDVEFEVTSRGKARGLFAGAFAVNRRGWFDRTMQDNRITRVVSVEMDVNERDLKTLGPLSLVLLDVDLYRSTRKALPELYEALSPGGIMIVDDCDPADIRWDGADQAYKEFMKGKRQPAQVVHGKLGIVRKQV